MEETPVELSGSVFFASWSKTVPARATRSARTIARETINGLIALGPKPIKKKTTPILRKFIEDLGGICTDIDTVSRKDILELFEEIVASTGLRGCGRLAEEWYDF